MTPVVAFGTKTRSSPRAPTKSPSAAGALAEPRRRSAAENATGLRSISSRAAKRAQHLARRGAERAVVEEGDSGVEEEQFTHGCRDHRIAAAATALRAADVT
ncbi:MAG: hypothetical protein U1F49_12825 [Rubrivivax sp.]